MEVELTSISARSTHPPDESTTPPAVSQGDEKAFRKSIETIEAGPPLRSLEPPPASAVTASTTAMRRKARIQFAALCWTLFLAGWNDGTPGPMLPRIQSVYHVRRFLRLTANRVDQQHLLP